MSHGMTVEPLRHPIYSPDGRHMWNGLNWEPTHRSPTVKRKHRFLYAILSFFITGLGTICAGRRWRGWLLFVLEFVFALPFYLLAAPLGVATPFSGETSLAGCTGVCSQEALVTLFVGVAAVVVWFYGMVDALRSARAWNQAHGWSS
jgi:hypothetical protein